MGRCADARLVLHRCERHARFCTGRFAQSWTIAATGAVGHRDTVALVATTCFALYLSWTPVESATINGIQGRYILPVLPLFAWLLPDREPALERVTTLAWYPVLVFPVVHARVLPGVIMERYYGSWQVMAASLKLLLLP